MCGDQEQRGTRLVWCGVVRRQATAEIERVTISNRGYANLFFIILCRVNVVLGGRTTGRTRKREGRKADYLNKYMKRSISANRSSITKRHGERRKHHPGRTESEVGVQQKIRWFKVRGVRREEGR
jgi:hypothetical protein